LFIQIKMIFSMKCKFDTKKSKTKLQKFSIYFE